MGKIVDWYNSYPTNLDTRRGMRTVRNSIHDTRASQINSLKDSVIALEMEVGSDSEETGSLRQRVTDLEGGGSGGGLGETMVEWNETDLTQFASKIEGSSVTSSTVTVVSYAGVNWIKFDVTSTSGSGFTDTAVILPFDIVPDNADYGVVVDFLYGNTGENGTFVGARFDGTDTLYIIRWLNSANTAYRPYKVINNVATLIGTNQHEPTTDVNMGSQIGLYLEGNLFRGYGKQQQMFSHTEITAKGVPCIGLTNNGNARSGSVYFRNIVVFKNRNILV